MRVLGIDPGLTRCGIGVVDGAPGRRLQLVHVEVACSDPGDDIATRLLADGYRFTTVDQLLGIPAYLHQ